MVSKSRPIKGASSASMSSLLSRTQSRTTQNISYNLPREFDNFFRQVRHLKRLLADTRASFDEINTHGYFDFERDMSSLMKVVEGDDGIAEELKKPPCIVIFGQDAECKATLVGELFGSPVIPLDPPLPDNETQRMIKFRHGKLLQCTLSVPGSFKEEYDLIEERHETYQSEDLQAIPIDELRLRGHEREDKALCTTILEVKVPHPILREGAELFVSSTNNPHKTTAQLFNQCVSDVQPIALFAINEAQLSSRDMDDLHQVRMLRPQMPFMFVQTSSPKDLTEFGYHERYQKIADQLQQLGFLSDPDILPAEMPNSVLHPPAKLFTQLDRELGFDRLSNYKNSSNNVDDCWYINIEDIDAQHARKKAAAFSARDDGLNYLPPSPETVRKMQNEAMQQEVKEEQPNAVIHALGRGRLENMNIVLSSKFVESRPPNPREQDRRLSNAALEYLDVEELGITIVRFVRNNLRAHLVNLATLLHNTHTRCLSTFIASAYDMSRENQITPKRLEYSRKKEQELFQSLLTIANKKQHEIRTLISETVHKVRDDLIQEAADYEFQDIALSGDVLNRSKDIRLCQSQIQELILAKLNARIADQLIGSVDQLRDNYIGVLRRCLEALEQSDNSDSSDSNDNIKMPPSALGALSRILNAAYYVQVTPQTTSTFGRAFLERMKEILAAMNVRSVPDVDREWRRKVAAEMVDGLSEARLARNICAQFKDRLEESHASFLSTLKQLEHRQNVRLERNEERRMQVRKNLAPKIARLSLESISLRDAVLYGMPRIGPEIGRGQYGVVYSCEAWGVHGPCAIKSVVPPDEKHWNDLAMEFYYTKSLPDHQNVVSLRGSVVDHSYGGGTAAVLLVMDRFPRDLYTGIKQGMTMAQRLRVSQDVVEGLRFMHSQGLVHRDIKLKNVLLDSSNRGKITDLGFCKPEAMMSGTIVGTPIHMSPELLKGGYDHTVDTYAFGILFWYVCSGSVRLPQNFEQCSSKENLWVAVQRGTRPERLPQFDDDCWQLMNRCWAYNPEHRPHLGVVQAKLSDIIRKRIAKGINDEVLTENTLNKGRRTSRTPHPTKRF